MDTITQLEGWTTEIAAAGQQLASYCRQNGVDGGQPPQLVVPADAPRAIQQTRRLLLRNLDHLRTLLSEPSDLVARLAGATQQLACLHWLGEFQVLACLPRTGSVPIADLARLANVPEAQLARIIRFTSSSAGFLQETPPGHVAHSPLSRAVGHRASLRDALGFLAATAAPGALHMSSSATPDDPGVEARPSPSFSFYAACDQQPKLHRRWSAYLQHTGADPSDLARQVLARVDWFNLNKTCVVEIVGPQCSTPTAVTLAQLHPELHFIVQVVQIPTSHHHHHPGSEEKIRVPPRMEMQLQRRELGTPQRLVRDTTLYVLNLHPLPPAVFAGAVRAELHAHLRVLATNRRATLIVVAGLLLPDPGGPAVDATVAATVRLHDLTLLQLAHQGLLGEAELVALVHSVGDSAGGRLVVMHRLPLPQAATVALGVKYQEPGGLG
ncbi:putative toxin biosynthesis regulatory protein AflJ [Aspergillus uvarum CBS 121591]|uniref:Putative toxin biosynthesis regulatory protein AflJ n=1 Tax=Aspergillus uvarum CBS 121591 TaxID=1448315 RepID=A0A319D3Y5_9EURO|nr:putative toxin biosynthesis regulatory protein AflJ [Aspergillus uvarum CBS 121591]PYH85733.1 putative toxin biosynthesis regulatory protein AflJ [Aspergillus uvarum CBS 121591]